MRHLAAMPADTLPAQYSGCLADSVAGRGAKPSTSLNALDLDTARLILNQVLEAYEGKEAKAMAVLEAEFEDTTAVLLLPEKYRKRLCTTNTLERMNDEIRRREWVIQIFPNRESALI